VIELRILSGKQAGASVVARRFPFLVGRSADSGLRLEDEGVFDRHFRIVLNASTFSVASEPNAVTAINNQPITEAPIRSGDTIQAGSVAVGFSLSPVRQRSLRFRESVVWLMLAGLCLAQVAVIYWLLGS
jgi:pSer/pThr/pTyr-binding forkhead associated (FHA) protein